MFTYPMVPPQIWVHLVGGSLWGSHTLTHTPGAILDLGL